jgi:hypothetical protein
MVMPRRRYYDYGDDDEDWPERERRIPRRSHAAIPVALAILLVGLVVGRWAVVVPVLLGIVLLSVMASFLSSRLNPLGIAFYLTTKPSWSAIGVIFLSALLLFLASGLYFVDVHAPIVPLGHP